jgi:hypothetical protein
MGSNQPDRNSKAENDRRAEELGRKAARLFRRGKPGLQQAITDARPRAEQAAKGALRYTQQHEDQIKRVALKGARLHLRGPFGFVFDALSNGLQGNNPPETAGDACPSCQSVNAPSARFCSQCGTRLTPS